MTPHEQGARKQKQTIIERYGKDYWRRIGKLGGCPLLLELRRKRLESQKCSSLPYKGIDDIAGNIGAR